MDAGTLVFGLVLGLAVPTTLFFLQRRKNLTDQTAQEERARLLIQAAQEKAEASLKEAEVKTRSELIKRLDEMEKEYSERQRDYNDRQRELSEQQREAVEQKRRIDKKEEQLDRKSEQLDRRERELDERRQRVEEERKGVEAEQGRWRDLNQQAQRKLEEVAGLTGEEAKRQLVSNLEEEARREAGRLIKVIEEETRETSTKKAQEIVATAVQRFAGEFVAEHTVSVVTIPSEEMKGRIIGREGRNIRALEAATGCDLIIDDTPEAVVISGFNPVRRQVAKRALEELVVDGRIHPARIEEVVRKVKKVINNEIREAGERAVFDVGLHNVHPEIIKLLGTLKFRTSYTQNVLNHSIEVAFFAGIMADELGLDSAMARRCGLLHDIGKAVDHEIEGPHAVIGGQLAKKYKEHPIVVNAISSHHFDEEPTSVYGPLTNASDALSAARPGARRETMETYVKRLEALEKIATDFTGVESAYAIQAGRELRVIVGSDRVNDEGTMMLARDIARRVESEMTYPGQIKVTVIRETRTTEIAH